MAAQETKIVNFFKTTLTQQMNPTDLVATVASVGSISASDNVYMCIEPSDAAQREVIFFDGTHGASFFSATTIGNRYLTGSAQASGLTHPVNSEVALVVLAQHIDDTHDRVDTNATDIATNVTDIATHRGSVAVAEHPLATNATDGFMPGTVMARYEAALDTDADMLTAIKNVDGTGSGLDADLLDGQEGSAYFDAASHTKAVHDALLIDADTLDGVQGSGYVDITNSQTIAGAKTFTNGITFNADIYSDGDWNIRRLVGSNANTLRLLSGGPRLYAPNAGDYLLVANDMVTAQGMDITATGGSFIGSGTTARLRAANGGNDYIEVDATNNQIEFYINSVLEMLLTPSKLTTSTDLGVGGGDIYGTGTVLNLRAAESGTDYFQVDGANNRFEYIINGIVVSQLAAGGDLQIDGELTASGERIIGSGANGKLILQPERLSTAAAITMDDLAGTTTLYGAVIPGTFWAYNSSDTGSLRWIATGSALQQRHTTSSLETKEAVETVDLDKSLFARLRGIHFKYRASHPWAHLFSDWEKERKHPRMGLAFEELAPVAPQFTYQTAEGMPAVDYDNMVPQLIADYVEVRKLVMRLRELVLEKLG